MGQILLDQVSKVYSGSLTGIDDLSLEIADGEFMVLVGPSGCGKSTALRSIAGLEEITSGTISIGSRVVNNLPPKDRDIAMVFQNYALYPHMTVEQNLAFGLQRPQAAEGDRAARMPGNPGHPGPHRRDQGRRAALEHHPRRGGEPGTGSRRHGCRRTGTRRGRGAAGG
jgi:ABC-type sugar transport system ATPase subunit